MHSNVLWSERPYGSCDIIVMEFWVVIKPKSSRPMKHQYSSSAWYYSLTWRNEAIWVRSQYKDCLSRYGCLNYKDKTVMRPSYLYNWNPIIGTKTSLYCIETILWSPYSLPRGHCVFAQLTGMFSRVSLSINHHWFWWLVPICLINIHYLWGTELLCNRTERCRTNLTHIFWLSLILIYWFITFIAYDMTAVLRWNLSTL